jgi:hypothetical protein
MKISDLEIAELFSLYKLDYIDLKQLRSSLVGIIDEHSHEPLFSVSYCREDDVPCLIDAVNVLFQSLGLNNLDIVQVVSIYARSISKMILAGSISWKDGADRISRASDKIFPLEFHDLDTFKYASSEWPERPKDWKFFQKGVFEEASIWARKDVANTKSLKA